MYITKALDAENVFSEEITIPGDGVLSAALTLTGSGSMRVVVQVRPRADTTWVDLFFAVGAGRYSLTPYGSGPMRFGVKLGDWTSGSIDGTMSYSRS